MVAARSLAEPQPCERSERRRAGEVELSVDLPKLRALESREPWKMSGAKRYTTQVRFFGPPKWFILFPRASERRVFQKEGGVNRSTYKRSSHM